MIRTTAEDGVFTITLDRPDKMNALTPAMHAALGDAFDRFAADPALRVCVVTGAGHRAFCAGSDVTDLDEYGSNWEYRNRFDKRRDYVRAIWLIRKPIVAAVQGAVAGGGLGLMLTADYIVAGDRAKFVSKYANIGLTPDLGVSTLLTAAVGQRRALQMLLQDRTIDAETAAGWGLVTEVAADPAARAAEVAQFWLDGATGAFGQAKRLVRTGAHRTFAENLADEARSIGTAFDTAESKARIAAFAAASRKSAAAAAASASSKESA